MAFYFIWTARDLNRRQTQTIKSVHHLREYGEGLKFKCTAKEKNEGGIFVNFMTGIAHGKGVVSACERWI